MSHYISQEIKKDPVKIRERMVALVKTYTEELELTRKFFEFLPKYEGKQITKRIATALEKFPGFEGYLIRYTVQYGMYHISAERREGYNTLFKIEWLIGYDTRPEINVEKLRGNNTCFFANEERIEKLNRGLEPGAVEELCEEWNHAIDVLKKINRDAKGYDCEYTFELDRKADGTSGR